MSLENVIEARTGYHFATRALATALAIISAAGCFIGIVAVPVVTAAQESTDMSWWELLLMILPFAAGLAFIVAYHTSKGKYGKFSRLANAFVPQWTHGYLGPLSTFWIGMCGAFSITALVTLAFPVRETSVDMGTVRILQDGEVLSAGTTFQSNRYEKTNIVFPLRLDYIHAYEDFADGRAYNRRATYVISIALRDGPALASVLAAHRVELGLSPDGDSQLTKEQLVLNLVDPYFQPKLARIVREVETGKISGSPASMLLRLGQVLNQDHAHQPAWLAYIQVSDLDIAGVSRTY